ncbi:UNVERIFIED_CONTAM: hypothetical protein NCL1_32972 [Trichonephila clavipes]
MADDEFSTSCRAMNADQAKVFRFLTRNIQDRIQGNDYRLRPLQGMRELNSEEMFGGLNVLLFGDLMQLPPRKPSIRSTSKNGSSDTFVALILFNRAKRVYETKRLRQVREYIERFKNR